MIPNTPGSALQLDAMKRLMNHDAERLLQELNKVEEEITVTGPPIRPSTDKSTFADQYCRVATILNETIQRRCKGKLYVVASLKAVSRDILNYDDEIRHEAKVWILGNKKDPLERIADALEKLSTSSLS